MRLATAAKDKLAALVQNPLDELGRRLRRVSDQAGGVLDVRQGAGFFLRQFKLALGDVLEVLEHGLLVLAIGQALEGSLGHLKRSTSRKPLAKYDGVLGETVRVGCDVGHFAEIVDWQVGLVGAPVN